MPDMPPEKVLRILDNVAGSSVILLSIEGGEPLLRKDLGEVLEYVNTKPLYILLTTSGQGEDDALQQELPLLFILRNGLPLNQEDDLGAEALHERAFLISHKKKGNARLRVAFKRPFFSRVASPQSSSQILWVLLKEDLSTPKNFSTVV